MYYDIATIELILKPSFLYLVTAQIMRKIVPWNQTRKIFYELFIFNTMNETGIRNCAHNIHNFYT